MEFFSSVCQRCGIEFNSEEFGGEYCFACEDEIEIEGADDEFNTEDNDVYDYEDCFHDDIEDWDD